LHFLSILDFVAYCRKRHIKVKATAFVGKTRRVRILPNLFGLVGIFLLSNGEGIGRVNGELSKLPESQG
jgi:hypothetical protein